MKMKAVFLYFGFAFVTAFLAYIAVTFVWDRLFDVARTYDWGRAVLMALVVAVTLSLFEFRRRHNDSH
ncbi:MAG: hypothetical protein D6743_07335 [Calditrichaeota bacterium]|nr:MAG: hypothetical protein D6743_07335 [Calditrichota bacterium]